MSRGTPAVNEVWKPLTIVHAVGKHVIVLVAIVGGKHIFCFEFGIVPVFEV